MRYLGRPPQGVASRSWCQIQAAVGLAVEREFEHSNSNLPAAGQPHRIGPAYGALQRFAKGDIGREEFEQKKSVLKR
jgi:hypothetical protein